MRLASDREIAVVGWLVTYGAVPGSDPAALAGLEPTIKDLKVVKTCNCGCPTVDFVEKGAGAPYRILAEAIANTPDAHMEFILWGSGEALTALEVVVYGKDGKTNRSLPSPDLLRTWEKAGEELRDRHDH